MEGWGIVKVLCVSDVHASGQALDAIQKILVKEKPDLLLNAGDTTHFGKSLFLKKFLSTVEKTKVPIIAVPGNIDEQGVWSELEKAGVSIHSKKRVFGGIEFVGFGGSPPTPFGTPKEYADEELYDSIVKMVSKKTVVLSHAPPHNTKADAIEGGGHVGCKSLRKLIEEKQPLACLCGHIHENQGVEKIGSTAIIKLGAAKDGHAAFVEFPSLKTSFFRLF